MEIIFNNDDFEKAMERAKKAKEEGKYPTLYFLDDHIKVLVSDEPILFIKTD